MGVLDLKGSTGWNYHTPEDEGYSEILEGTVVEISTPQARNYMTKEPEWWDEAHTQPKLNIKLCILKQDGEELPWIFSPKSVAANACLAALDPQNNRGRVSVSELLGKFVRVQTQAGSYNMKNPRPWWVTIIGEGDSSKVRGVFDGAPKPQPQAAPAPAPANPQLAQAQQRAAQAMNIGQSPVAPMPVPQQPPVQQPAPQYQQPATVYDEEIPF